MRVDLRSDTVTLPTEAMKQAMFKADVGDDVYLEDPTISKLEEKVAEITGKEAGLFVPSGSQGNLISLYLACGRGNEVLAHEKSHIIHYEMASPAAVAGVLPIPVLGARGILKPAALEPKLRPGVYYAARTKMIEVENTGNLVGGLCYQKNELEEVYRFAKSHDLWVHMDGARLWNAAVATKTPIDELASQADSVNVCFSKGLGAPVGSALAGPSEFIQEARRIRKMLGGGMRQAGYLAAGALYALENHIQRMEEDHHHAKLLGAALEECSWAQVNSDSIETNILFFDVVGRSTKELVQALSEKGILVSALGDSIRLVTHLDINRKMVDYTIREFQKL